MFVEPIVPMIFAMNARRKSNEFAENRAAGKYGRVGNYGTCAASNNIESSPDAKTFVNASVPPKNRRARALWYFDVDGTRPRENRERHLPPPGMMLPPPLCSALYAV